MQIQLNFLAISILIKYMEASFIIKCDIMVHTEKNLWVTLGSFHKKETLNETVMNSVITVYINLLKTLKHIIALHVDSSSSTILKTTPNLYNHITVLTYNPETHLCLSGPVT